ncbi:hypothetical protein CVS40_1208 [Lucilia cuprina]|nr:hypothetical protein CVS40_1208 [Lucilia cuprina]
MKKLNISELPAVLVITFEEENLNMFTRTLPFSESRRRNTTKSYELYAVSNHLVPWKWLIIQHFVRSGT